MQIENNNNEFTCNKYWPNARKYSHIQLAINKLKHVY